MNTSNTLCRLLPALSILALAATLPPSAAAQPRAVRPAHAALSEQPAQAAPSEQPTQAARSEQPGPAAQSEQPTRGESSGLRLDAGLIKDFLEVLFFGDDGRFHFREYFPCSYQFVQNPRVSVQDGLVLVTADYYARRGSEGLGGCVGTPGIDTTVTVSARVTARGSGLAIEILNLRSETLPALTSVILDLVGIKLPYTHEFDLMAAINNVLYENQRFGVSSLEVHEVLMEDEAVLVRMTVRLGVW